MESFASCFLTSAVNAADLLVAPVSVKVVGFSGHYYIIMQNNNLRVRCSHVLRSYRLYPRSLDQALSVTIGMLPSLVETDTMYTWVHAHSLGDGLLDG